MLIHSTRINIPSINCPSFLSFKGRVYLGVEQTKHILECEFLEYLKWHFHLCFACREVISDAGLDRISRYKLIDSIAEEVEKIMNKSDGPMKANEAVSAHLMGETDTLFKIAYECGVPKKEFRNTMNLQQEQIDTMEKKLLGAKKSMKGIEEQHQVLKKFLLNQSRPRKM